MVTAAVTFLRELIFLVLPLFGKRLRTILFGCGLVCVVGSRPPLRSLF